MEGSESIRGAEQIVPSVAIVAGEASGDVSAAALAEELRRLHPDISLWGAGGPKMRDAGIELVADFARAGSIGIVQSLKQVPRLLFEYQRLKKEFIVRRPDVFVPIDFGAFNVRLGKFVREQGIRTVYYFPPGSWRRRPRDHSNLLAASDRIITPFPWSADILTKAGADAVFLGHPLLDIVQPLKSREQFFDMVGDVPPDAKVIGLLPGSRTHEIANILPAFIDACELINEQVPSISTFMIAAGSDRAVKQINGIIARKQKGKLKIKFYIAQGQTYDVMAYSDLLLTCSGTATLEAMILGTPMIIVYRGSKLMKLEYLLRKAILEQFIGMPNIIAGKQICKELLADDASPEAIAELAISYLQNPAELEKIKQDLNDAKQILGEPGGTARAAKIILEMAGLHPKLGLDSVGK